MGVDCVEGVERGVGNDFYGAVAGCEKEVEIGGIEGV